MKGHRPDPCASCSSSDCCLFIQQQMAASASHADRLSVTGRNGQISATQPFRGEAGPNHTLPSSPQAVVACPPHPPESLWTRAADAGPAASRMTKTTQRLREATSQTKHAKPAGPHSQTEQTRKFNNGRDVRQPLR